MGQDAVRDERHQGGFGRVQPLQVVARVLVNAAADAGVDDVADLVRRGIDEVLARRHALSLDVDANHLIGVVVDRIGAADAEMRHRLAVNDDIPVRALATRRRDKAGAPLRHLVAVRVIEEGERPPHGERRSDGANEDGDLLTTRGRAHQKSGLEIL